MSEAVHAFFSQWDMYRLCIEHNTLFHREVGNILRRELQEQTGPFTFLDLACGDTELTAEALRGTKVAAYTGVDFSAPAIALAAEKTAALACPRRFHCRGRRWTTSRFLCPHRIRCSWRSAGSRANGFVA
jgi:SAM-dependent methyltransferase